MSLDGLVPLQFEGGNLLPVVVVDDLTRPGMSPARGRRFGCPVLSHGIGSVTFFVATIDVTVEQVSVSSNVLGNIELFMYPDITALVGGTPTGAFMDRPVSVTDRPGILSAVVVDPAAGVLVGSRRAEVNTSGVFETPFTLGAGRGFLIRSLTGSCNGGMIYGWQF